MPCSIFIMLAIVARCYTIFLKILDVTPLARIKCHKRCLFVTTLNDKLYLHERRVDWWMSIWNSSHVWDKKRHPTSIVCVRTQKSMATSYYNCSASVVNHSHATLLPWIHRVRHCICDVSDWQKTTWNALLAFLEVINTIITIPLIPDYPQTWRDPHAMTQTLNCTHVQ